MDTKILLLLLVFFVTSSATVKPDCPAGYHLGTPEICIPCEDGYYAEKPNRKDTCDRCTQCSGGHDPETRCNATQNTVCQCKPGETRVDNACYPVAETTTRPADVPTDSVARTSKPTSISAGTSITSSMQTASPESKEIKSLLSSVRAEVKGINKALISVRAENEKMKEMLTIVLAKNQELKAMAISGLIMVSVLFTLAIGAFGTELYYRQKVPKLGRTLRSPADGEETINFVPSTAEAFRVVNGTGNSQFQANQSASSRGNVDQKTAGASCDRTVTKNAEVDLKQEKCRKEKKNRRK